MKNVLGNDNALFFSIFWKHMLANTLLLHNFTYFYVAKEDLKVYHMVNPPTGSQQMLGEEKYIITIHKATKTLRILQPNQMGNFQS